MLLLVFLLSSLIALSCVVHWLVVVTLSSTSQMLPSGKQKHLSTAQPWLSLSDKSWGGLCQCCPPCQLSHSYTMSTTQRSHIQYTPHPICTQPPSSWQSDRSRWFTPFLPSGLPRSCPWLAHLCWVQARLSPLANTNWGILVWRYFCSPFKELKSILLLTFSKHPAKRSDKWTFAR